jgi:hypothetical protein
VRDGSLPARAARLAAAVAGLGDPAWRADAERIAGAPAPGTAAPPTYGELAVTGVALVEALATGGRWDEAAGQARHLTRFFTAERRRLSPVAGHVFDGLQAAAIARDPDELRDFADLVREMFG